MTGFTEPVRRRRRPSLTPMIDVVFLLLVFFMLASRFGLDQVLPLSTARGGTLSGPPRLVDVLPDGYRLNGVATQDAALIADLQQLVTDPATDTVVLRGADEVDTQRIVDVAGFLAQAGFRSIVLAE